MGWWHKLSHKVASHFVKVAQVAKKVNTAVVKAEKKV